MKTDRRRFLQLTTEAGLLTGLGCGLEKTGEGPPVRREPAEGWVSLFRGETLEGWEAYDQKGKQRDFSSSWVVRRGIMHGSGGLSHLYTPRGDYKNFRYRAELKISDGGNSGMYFRAAKGAGFPRGYEAQVNSTHTDPVRTGSLYNMVLIKKRLVPPDTWFIQEVEAVGNHITVRVGDETLYEFVDPNNTYTMGYFAFQQHDPGSEVQIRRIEVMELPD
jgi:hypothetical protein